MLGYVYREEKMLLAHMHIVPGGIVLSIIVARRTSLREFASLSAREKTMFLLLYTA